MNPASIFWLIAIVVFLMVEGATVAMVSLWFAFGSLAALIASLLGGAVWLQALLFFLISAALLAALRPVVRKHFTPKLTKTNMDAVIGSQGYVTAPVDNVAAQGQVKLGAMVWTARSTSGEPIKEGTLVRVDKIEGVKVFVSPVREEVSV